MIVHRDYMSGRHAIIKIFSDHIIFYNPGTLPADITLSELLADNYISSPRNLQIAKIFKEMGFIERYGTGIKRIRKLFLEDQLPEPEFKLVQNGFLVKVFSKHERLDERLSNNQRKIIILIGKYPQISITQLSKEIKISRNAVDKNIQKLKEKNIIERIGPARGGYWKIKTTP